MFTRAGVGLASHPVTTGIPAQGVFDLKTGDELVAMRVLADRSVDLGRQGVVPGAWQAIQPRSLI